MPHNALRHRDPRLPAASIFEDALLSADTGEADVAGPGGEMADEMPEPTPWPSGQ